VQEGALSWQSHNKSKRVMWRALSAKVCMCSRGLLTIRLTQLALDSSCLGRVSRHD